MRQIIGLPPILLDDTKILGSTEIWTRIAGFRVLSANHYTMEPNIEIPQKFA